MKRTLSTLSFVLCASFLWAQPVVPQSLQDCKYQTQLMSNVWSGPEWSLAQLRQFFVDGTLPVGGELRIPADDLKEQFRYAVMRGWYELSAVNQNFVDADIVQMIDDGKIYKGYLYKSDSNLSAITAASRTGAVGSRATVSVRIKEGQYYTDATKGPVWFRLREDQSDDASEPIMKALCMQMQVEKDYSNKSTSYHSLDPVENVVFEAPSNKPPDYNPPTYIPPTYEPPTYILPTYEPPTYILPTVYQAPHYGAPQFASQPYYMGYVADYYQPIPFYPDYRYAYVNPFPIGFSINISLDWFNHGYCSYGGCSYRGCPHGHSGNLGHTVYTCERYDAPGVICSDPARGGQPTRYRNERGGGGTSYTNHSRAGGGNVSGGYVNNDRGGGGTSYGSHGVRGSSGNTYSGRSGQSSSGRNTVSSNSVRSNAKRSETPAVNTFNRNTTKTVRESSRRVNQRPARVTPPDHRYNQYSNSTTTSQNSRSSNQNYQSTRSSSNRTNTQSTQSSNYRTTSQTSGHTWQRSTGGRNSASNNRSTYQSQSRQSAARSDHGNRSSSVRNSNNRSNRKSSSRSSGRNRSNR